MMKWVIILMLVGCAEKKVTTRFEPATIHKVKPVEQMNKFDSLKLINPHKQ